MPSSARNRPVSLLCSTMRPPWVLLCFAALLLVLPQIRGRGRTARAFLCHHCGHGRLRADASPSRAPFQNGYRKEATAATEGELQSLLARREYDHQIFVDAPEIALTANLRIDGTGRVSLVGDGKGATTIRCTKNSTGTALVIRCDHPFHRVSTDGNDVTRQASACAAHSLALCRLRQLGRRRGT